MPKLLDLTGKRFGRLTVISRADDYFSPGGHKLTQWKCKCDCGKEVIVSGNNLKSGRQISCGCYNKEKGEQKLVDITGRRYGHLTVISYSHRGKRRNHFWNCICDCGKEACVNSAHLKNGTTKSCGCLRYEVAHARKKIKSHRLHTIWSSMKQRCNNPNNAKYKSYGGRGVKICEDWLDFSNFFDWAINNGYSDNLSIDRIDVNGNYEPSNCRWVSNKIQARNKQNTVYLEYEGISKSISDWADEKGISHEVIKKRMSLGWTAEEILNIPVLPTGKNKSQKEELCQ